MAPLSKTYSRVTRWQLWLWSLLLVQTLFFGQACEPAFQPASGDLLHSQSGTFLSEEEKLACQATRSIQSEDLQNITDLVSYLNTLPRPLQLHCVIAGLPRPLRLTAGVSSGSAQPSPGARDPRIILQVGSLLLGIVPDGPAQGSLEVGAVKGGDTAARAEFLFPIAEVEIQEAAGTGHIRFGAGTSCGLCHTSETAASSEPVAGSFQSRIIRFNPAERVTVANIKTEAELCRGQSSDRCLLLRSLFQGGTPVDAEY